MFYSLKEIYHTRNSKLNFLKGLISIIKVDGNITEEERDLFQNLLNILEIPNKDHEIIYKILDSDETAIEITFENKLMEKVFIKEGLQLSLIDAKYHNKEKELLGEYVEKFDLENDFLTQLEVWQKLGEQWYQKGLDLFNLDQSLRGI